MRVTPLPLSVFLLLLPFGTARAAGPVDQELVVRGAASMARVNTEFDLAQTFTVGQTGLLDRVEVQVEAPSSPALRPVAPLIVELRRTSDGLPDPSAAGVLATFSVPPASVPTSVFVEPMLGIDLAAQSLPVAAGDVLALGLRSDETAVGGRGYQWALTTLNVQMRYPGGEMHSRPANTGDDYVRLSDLPNNPSNIDGGFRTFITVPEPAGAALLVASAPLLTRRKREGVAG